MNKAYVKWQLKRWLPWFIVFFVILSITSLNWVGFMPIGRTTNYYYSAAMSAIHRRALSTPYSGSIALTVIGYILAFIAPFAVFSYRWSAKRADCFCAVPAKEKELVRTRFLLALVSFLVVCAVVFWVGVIVIACRAAAFPNETYYTDANGESFTLPYVATVDESFFATYNAEYAIVYAQGNYQFWAYVVLFLCYLILLALAFSISSFFVSLASNIWQAILLFAYGMFLLGMLVPGLASYLMTFISRDHAEEYMMFVTSDYYAGTNGLDGGIFGASSPIVAPISYISYAFDDLVFGYNPWPTLAASYWYGPVFFVAFGIAGFLYVFFRHEPSGEHWGRNARHEYAVSWVIHAGILTWALAMGPRYITINNGYYTSFSWIQLFVSVIGMAVGYLVSLWIYKRSWHLGKR